MFDVQGLIKKKLGEIGLTPPVEAPFQLPAGLAVELPRPPVEPLESPGVMPGIGAKMPQIEPMERERIAAPSLNPKMEGVLTPTVEADPPGTLSGTVTDEEPVQKPQSLTERLKGQLQEIDSKDYSIEKDESGNVVRRGKDRDKKWSTWEKIGGAVIGMLEEGIPGAISGATDRDYVAKMKDKFKRAQIVPKYEQAAKIEDRENKIEATDTRLKQADQRIKTANTRAVGAEYDRGFRRAMAKLKLGYKKGANPALDTELAQYGIDVDQWDDNSKTFWQGQNLMTFDEKGEAVPVVRDGVPVTDITRKPVEVEYDGGKYTVSQTVALQSLTNAGRINTQIQNQTIDDENEWRETLAKNETKRREIAAEVEGIGKSITGLQQANDYKRQQIAAIEDEIKGTDDEDVVKSKRAEIIRLKSEIETNDRQWREAEAKRKTKEGERNSIVDPPKPQKRQQTTVPKTVPKNKDPMGLFQ